MLREVRSMLQALNTPNSPSHLAGVFSQHAGTSGSLDETRCPLDGKARNAALPLSEAPRPLKFVCGELTCNQIIMPFTTVRAPPRSPPWPVVGREPCANFGFTDG